MQNELELSMMKGDAFNGIKSDFDNILRRTLGNMEKKESNYAEITLKMKITLENDWVLDTQITTHKADREIITPKFEHKLSSVLQIKDEVSGSLKGRYELVWDKERGQYIMREVSDGQTSIFDKADAPPPKTDYVVAEFEENNDNLLPPVETPKMLVDYHGKEVNDND